MSTSIIKGDNIHYPQLTWWSAPQARATIIGGAGADVVLPDIVVPALPGWATGLVARVELVLVFRKCLDTSVAANQLNGDQNVQVQKSVAGAYTTGITLKDNMFAVASSAESSGTFIIGDTDVKAQCNTPGTFNVKITTGRADGANLELHDVQVGLRFTFFR